MAGAPGDPSQQYAINTGCAELAGAEPQAEETGLMRIVLRMSGAGHVH